MKKLNYEELNAINGGGLSVFGTCALVTAIVSFVSGFIDGYTRPHRCK